MKATLLLCLLVVVVLAILWSDRFTPSPTPSPGVPTKQTKQNDAAPSHAQAATVAVDGRTGPNIDLELRHRTQMGLAGRLAHGAPLPNARMLAIIVHEPGCDTIAQFMHQGSDKQGSHYWAVRCGQGGGDWIVKFLPRGDSFRVIECEVAGRLGMTCWERPVSAGAR